MSLKDNMVVYFLMHHTKHPQHTHTHTHQFISTLTNPTARWNKIVFSLQFNILGEHRKLYTVNNDAFCTLGREIFCIIS